MQKVTQQPPPIGKWISYFEKVEWLVTDQVSHFKTSLMDNLASYLHMKYHLTAAYCQWMSGTADRVCKELPRVLRALMLEWWLSFGKWLLIFDVVQRTLNHLAVDRHKMNGDQRCRDLAEAFLGLKPSPRIARLSPMRTYKDTKLSTGKHAYR